MNRICRKAVAAAGALALAGGTALAASAPASAATGSDNFSFAAQVNGFLSTGEVALAENSFGRHVVTVGHVSLLSNLLTAGSVVDTANNNGASSSVASVHLRSILAALGLSARIVHSSCSNPNANVAPTGTTTIVGGLIGLGGFGQPLNPFPSVNEPVFLPGGITVLLNNQSNDGAGHLVVNGMLIELPGGQDITVATSVCDGEPST